MKYLILLTSLLLGTLLLWGCDEDLTVDPVQIGSIRGQVLLSTNRQPVRNALVRLTPSGRITESDSSGNFRFDSVTAGKYSVQVTKEGYRNEIVTVEATYSLVSVLTVLLVNDQSQNRPPTAPNTPSPASGTTNVTNLPLLKWTSTDPNRDTLTYDLRLFQDGNTTPVQSFTGLRADSLQLTTPLAYNTTYFWQVTAKDGVNTVNGDVWSFRTMAYPDYSYLFVRRMDGQFQIYGGNTTQSAMALTSSGSNWRPIASPNRQQIAFISNLETDLHLYVMNTDGSNRRRVTTVPVAGLSASDLSFCWSPDGTQLVYPSNDRLYAVRTDGAGLRRIAQAGTGQTFSGCDWNAAAGRIVARVTNGTLYNNALVSISPDNGSTTTLLNRPNGRLGNPIFSVNGRQVLFSYDVGEFQDDNGRQLDARIFLLTIATGELADLSLYRIENQNTTTKPAGTNDLDPRFSPTGGRIIFTNTDNTGIGQRTVLTIDATGGNRTVLLQPAEMPYWR